MWFFIIILIILCICSNQTTLNVSYDKPFNTSSSINSNSNSDLNSFALLSSVSNTFDPAKINPAFLGYM